MLIVKTLQMTDGENMQRKQSRSAFRSKRNRRRKRLVANYTNNEKQHHANADTRQAKLLANLVSLFGGLEYVSESHYGYDRPLTKRVARQKATSASIVFDYRKAVVDTDTGYIVPNPELTSRNGKKYYQKAYRPKSQQSYAPKQNEAFWVICVDGVDYVVCNLSVDEMKFFGLTGHFERMTFEPDTLESVPNWCYAAKRDTLSLREIRKTLTESAIYHDTVNNADIISAQLPKLG